ncbi:MAG: hydrolase [Candidatus Doudnabacteria bacterium Gr01-1014_77]|uniref:Hydrolase n=1 Tax=Candidatus Doudnabacteria bacterium Gr01-1014_77 TaxID=2017133 RepID=A0A554JDJ7_9BACT|nr:MAG: hydrolase [Candidatus Doudnabacteria bacterium Gr01-1014_77]
MFLEKINVQPEYIVGHSFGGRIILKALAQKKLFPKKVVLIASAGVTKANATRNGLLFLLAKLGKFVVGLFLLPSFQKKIKQRFYNLVQSDYSTAGVLTGTYLNIIKEDLSGLVKDITVPVLLIWGSDDKATPLSDANFLAREIQGSKLEVFEGKTHFVHKEEPEAVLGLIKEFCR